MGINNTCLRSWLCLCVFVCGTSTGPNIPGPWSKIHKTHFLLVSTSIVLDSTHIFSWWRNYFWMVAISFYPHDWLIDLFLLNKKQGKQTEQKINIPISSARILINTACSLDAGILSCWIGPIHCETTRRKTPTTRGIYCMYVNIMLLILYWHGIHASKSYVLHCTVCSWGQRQNDSDKPWGWPLLPYVREYLMLCLKKAGKRTRKKEHDKIKAVIANLCGVGSCWSWISNRYAKGAFWFIFCYLILGSSWPLCKTSPLFSQVDWCCKTTRFSYTLRISKNEFPSISSFSKGSNYSKFHPFPKCVNKNPKRSVRNPKIITRNSPKIRMLRIASAAAGSSDLGFERLLVFRGLRLLRLVRAFRRAGAGAGAITDTEMDILCVLWLHIIFGIIL